MEKEKKSVTKNFVEKIKTKIKNTKENINEVLDRVEEEYEQKKALNFMEKHKDLIFKTSLISILWFVAMVWAFKY
jgi:hypothetical protein